MSAFARHAGIFQVKAASRFQHLGEFPAPEKAGDAEKLDAVGGVLHNGLPCFGHRTFRRWELGQLLEPGRSYHLEDAGVTREGTQLLAIYRGERAISNRKADAA